MHKISTFERAFSLSKTVFEDDTEIVELETEIENVFKLRAPVVYTMEDLVMSVTLLLILVVMLMIWYGAARCIIFLVYHKTNKRTNYYYDIHDELLSI